MNPEETNGRHLSRLERVWLRDPIYFVTACTMRRDRVLACNEAHEVLREVWQNAATRSGWRIGRYVIMPDHVHFFCAPNVDSRPLSSLVGKWKEWTAKYLSRRFGFTVPLWQAEFFDHALRSQESYGQKWEYVRQNPVRGCLVKSPDAWPFQGELTELRVDEVKPL